MEHLGVIHFLLMSMMAWMGASANSAADLFDPMVEYCRVTSGGYRGSNRIEIRIGDKGFYYVTKKGPKYAGLYVVGVLNNRLMLKQHYNFFMDPEASGQFARDVKSLPHDTIVIVAAKDEATRQFDERSQEALKRIGAQQGLLNQPYRCSYLCIGKVGLKPGEAIEQVGMDIKSHYGARMLEPIDIVCDTRDLIRIVTEPGMHDGLMIGHTEVIYYIPKNFDPHAAEYMFLIHGAGDWHHNGAYHRIDAFNRTADRLNMVLIAPCFEIIPNRAVDTSQDINENGRWKNLDIVRDPYLSYFQVLLNNKNSHRSDLELIKIFEYFNEQLMPRQQFHLFGHSGGGQFVNRFILFHPELVSKVAISAAGTFTFPYSDQPYPWGLDFTNLEEYFGQQINPRGIRLSPTELDQKMNCMLDLDLHIIVGADDTEPDGIRRLKEIGWQGINHIEKAKNFFEAMRQEHQRQIDLRNRRQNDPFRFKLHILENIGHNSVAGQHKAIEVLFMDASP